ncbi:hypothetical protein BZG36_00851 [Bifiguratus adelaidae]|uniref:Chitinase n=1 Tax=Bifiguratus adelaidae TaxID=1938954 RepID=A0A261Y6H1_9FUNG|nr:hypothetical protein BZG36_00851 [Bifiguratus adelaidae]
MSLCNLFSARPGSTWLFVQFCNNYCYPGSGKDYNFAEWDTWAKTVAINKDVKVFLGLAGSKTAADTGYTPWDQLRPVLGGTQNNYTSFGGVMMWDASEATANKDGGDVNYAKTVSDFIKQNPHCNSTTASYQATLTNALPQNTAPSAAAFGPVECPIIHQPCTTEGEYRCAGANVAVCSQDHWTMFPCSADGSFICQSLGDNAYCDWASGKTPICTHNGTYPSLVTATPSPPFIQYVSIDSNITSSIHYGAIHIRTLSTPLSYPISLQFQLQGKMQSTSLGNFTQQGNNTTLNLIPPPMHMSFTVQLAWTANSQPPTALTLQSKVSGP